MAFTYPTDQQRLQTLLGLPRYELEENSLLYELMQKVDTFDSENPGLNIADAILTIADTLDTPSTGLLAQESAAQVGVKSLTVEGEYSITYGGGGSTVGLTSKISSAKSSLLRLLDPDGLLQRAQNFNPYPEDRYPTPDGIYGVSNRWRYSRYRPY